MLAQTLDLLMTEVRETPQGRIHTALSVLEVLTIKDRLGDPPMAEGMPVIDGRPHLVLVTPEGEVMIDVGAFFGPGGEYLDLPRG